MMNVLVSYISYFLLCLDRAVGEDMEIFCKIFSIGVNFIPIHMFFFIMGQKILVILIAFKVLMGQIQDYSLYCSMYQVRVT